MRPEPLSDQTLTTRQRCWACPRPPQLPDEAPAPGRCLRVLGNWPAMRDPRSRSLARLRLSRAAPHGGHPGLPCGGAPSALHTMGSAQPYVLPSRSVKPSGEVAPPPCSGTAGWGLAMCTAAGEPGQGRPGGGAAQLPGWDPCGRWSSGAQAARQNSRGQHTVGPRGGNDRAWPGAGQGHPRVGTALPPRVSQGSCGKPFRPQTGLETRLMTVSGENTKRLLLF